MAKRPISYTSRDFQSIKNDLVEYAKRYYPSTFMDFNEASFGSMMLDMVSYIGDQLSFYTDYQANETFIDSALEFNNVVRLAEQMGHKMPGSPTSVGVCAFYVIVPASATASGPDFNYIPILKRGALLNSQGGVSFTLNEDVDFSDSSNQITVARVDESTGTPTYFAIKAYGQVISGQVYVKNITIGAYQRFLRVPLDASNVIEIVSVTDTQGNEYREVEYLSQDVILEEVPNYSTSRTAVPFIMKLVPVPRRFQTEFDSVGEAFLQFGYGSAENITTNIIKDPADVVLDVTGREYISDATFDPSNLVASDKFGVAPADTTLTVVYRSNNGGNVNAAVGTVNSVLQNNLVFQNEGSLNAITTQEVINTLEVDNETPILGDTSTLMPDEVRERAYASYASQNRAVTRADYMTVCYRMPSKFGKIKRVNIVQDPNSFKRNLNLYVLSEDTDGNFVAPNEALKNNLKTWISRYRMINDTVDILDAKIINYCIDFEVIPELDINRFQLLQSCINTLREKMEVKYNIGEAIYISEIYKILNDVPGVIDTTNVEIRNKAGGLYSEFYYDINSNLSDDGRFVIIPENAVAEILFPDKDISGAIK